MAGEVTAVVVEIKNTDWDAFAADRVRPNLRRHLRQLQDYLDHYVDHIRRPQDSTRETTDSVDTEPLTWDTVIGVLLYPRRPDPARATLIEDVALEQALTVVWYDEADWHSGRRQSSPTILADCWLSNQNV
jgi:hypothetical protein